MNPFYESLEHNIASGKVVFSGLSDFIKEGLCAYRERNAGLAPAAPYASDVYYETLLELRAVSPARFDASYSETTSRALDAYVEMKAVSERGMRNERRAA